MFEVYQCKGRSEDFEHVPACTQVPGCVYYQTCGCEGSSCCWKAGCCGHVRERWRVKGRMGEILAWTWSLELEVLTEDCYTYAMLSRDVVVLGFAKDR